MTTRVWNGGTGDWYNALDWTTGVAPIPGDAARVSAGTLEMFGTEAAVSFIFDNQTVTLGATSGAAPAEIISIGARYGHAFSIQTPVTANSGAFLSLGQTGFAGTFDVNGGAFQISTESAGGQPGGAFVLDTDAQLSIAAGATLTVLGRLDDDGAITVNPNGTLVNTGLIDVEQSQGGEFLDSGTLTGGGTVDVGLNAIAAVALAVSNQTFAFAGLGGGIDIASPNYFLSTIQNFVDGDFIDLVGIQETSASYNATTDTLSVDDVRNGVMSDATSLHVLGPTATATLAIASDGNGGSIIEFANSPKPHQEDVEGGADALGAQTVHATLTTHSGTPITGAGIRIGIISNSFNDLGGANTDASEGYLPATASGTSAVDVLSDDPGGGDDEGRAMAELVYQVAPGAQIYFDAGTGGQTGEATAINALVAAGVDIIVDDESISDEPFFQVTGPDDTAIQNAINAGVNYFTSATNYANNYDQANFTATPTTLTGIDGPVLAQTFTNGTPYEEITLTGTTNIDLQWSAPFPTSPGGSSPLAMNFVLTNMSGQIVYASQQDTSATGSAYASEPDIFQNGVAPGTYDMAVYQTAGMPSVQQFKFILYGAEDAGIDDPAAGNGSGAEHGHDLVPDVNTVAAATFPDSPAFTGDDQTEWFSAAGPGELLYDSNGNPTTPVSAGKPDFTGPDGIDVSPDLSLFQPFYGTSAAAPDVAAVAALMLQANPSLTPADVTADLAASAQTLGLPVSQQGAGLVQAVGAVDLALMACFASGTRLATTRGDVAVEALREGDLMRTARATAARVIWIGHRRIDCTRHPRPDEVWPVHVRPHAMGAGRPHRDLWLSPDHAVFTEGVLIPCKYLINGGSIAQEPRDEVTYWHVELARHDVLLAEGLPCESYLDTGNRGAFANAGIVQLNPDFAPAGGEAMWEAAACAPLRLQRPSAGRVRHPTTDLLRLLQPSWYLARNPDVAGSGIDAATHYRCWGRAEGRPPCPEIDLVRRLGLVDPGILIFSMADVVIAGADPVAHFCTGGWREHRRPNAYFDTAWYLDTHDVPAGTNPVLHYVLAGEPSGFRPSRHFDPTWYRRRYRLSRSTCLLAHYLDRRRSGKLSPLPDFDVDAYSQAHAGTLLAQRDPYAHFLAIGRFAAA